MNIEPIILEGDFVRLEPLKMEHLEPLCEVGLLAELWRLIPTRITSPEAMKNYIQIALDEQNQGLALPFVTVAKSENKIIGSTRFANIDVKNRRAEIGWTWINPHWQRTFINTEAKFLMLTQAFEIWKCVRIELKTDALNEQSRRAILRLGAKEEGVLRHHLITDTGRIRDTVYFSILDDEWAGVKRGLEEKINRHRV